MYIHFFSIWHLERFSDAIKPQPRNYMKTKLSLIGLLAIFASSPLALAQTPTSEGYTQRLFYIDVHPGKNGEWRDLIEETTMKVAQLRANSGEILSWTLMQSVYPSGEEARSDYLISVISSGSPREYKKSYVASLEPAGSSMSAYEWSERNVDCSIRVASELWQVQIYNGSAQVGNYISLKPDESARLGHNRRNHPDLEPPCPRK